MSQLSPHTGLPEKSRQPVALSLQKLLSNTYLLYAKTQVFHWNVEGIHFHSLHGMFEKQYGQLAGAVDEIAERLRTLGYKTPGGLKELLSFASLEESSGDFKAVDMLQALLDDHEQLCLELRKDIEEAGSVDDVSHADFFTGRLQEHEKTAWMLRSSLSE